MEKEEKNQVYFERYTSDTPERVETLSFFHLRCCHQHCRCHRFRRRRRCHVIVAVLRTVVLLRNLLWDFVLICAVVHTIQSAYCEFRTWRFSLIMLTLLCLFIYIQHYVLEHWLVLLHSALPHCRRRKTYANHHINEIEMWFIVRKRISIFVRMRKCSLHTRVLFAFTV